jgi:hypothetical protein
MKGMRRGKMERKRMRGIDEICGWLGRWEGNREGEWVEGWWMAKMEGRAEMTGVRGWLWFSLPWACLHPPLPTLEPGLHAIAAQSSCSSAPCPPSVQCSESISQPTIGEKTAGGGVPSTRMISSPPPFLFSRSIVLDHQAGCACSFGPRTMESCKQPFGPHSP